MAVGGYTVEVCQGNAVPGRITYNGIRDCAVMAVQSFFVCGQLTWKMLKAYFPTNQV